jgi:hypothetical protein
MAFTAKPLADGQLPSAIGTLYTVPASTRTYVKIFQLYNTDTVDRLDTVYVNVSGTRRAWHPALLVANGGSADILEDGESLQMEAGDFIEGVAAAANVVDYFITGVEET